MTAFYCAPLEGVTGYAFRRAHARYFAPADKYFAPFFAPTREHVFPPRVLRELSPANNAGVRAVPQLLCRSAEDFVWAANALAGMGYGEVNLNLGCPSGTVTAKGKGSGLLSRPQELRHFLEQVFSAVDVRVSVKTRLGFSQPEEFPPLLEIFNGFPISELTVHARVRADMYRPRARSEWFVYALEHSRAPICCNGDFFSAPSVRAFLAERPDCPAVMLGRGLAAVPELTNSLRALPPRPERARRAALRGFHAEIYETCAADFGSERSAMLRMKELWNYLRFTFTDCEREMKRVLKSKSPSEFLSAAEAVLLSCPLAPEPAYRPKEAAV